MNKYSNSYCKKSLWFSVDNVVNLISIRCKHKFHRESQQFLKHKKKKECITEMKVCIQSVIFRGRENYTIQYLLDLTAQ